MIAQTISDSLNKVESKFSTSSLPAFTSVKWLPCEAFNALKHKYEFCEALSKNKDSKSVSLYTILCKYINRILPAFNDRRMKITWNKLLNISEKSTGNLAYDLFEIENMHEGSISNIKKLTEMKSDLDKAQTAFKRLQEKHPNLACNIIIPNQNLIDSKTSHNQKSYDPFFEIFPVSRKGNIDKALPIFFAKFLHKYFKDNFNKPMCVHISILLEVIFDVSYSEPEISQLASDKS